VRQKIWSRLYNSSIADGDGKGRVRGNEGREMRNEGEGREKEGKGGSCSTNEKILPISV